MRTSNFFDASTIAGFQDRLASVNIDTLSIAPYCKRYLQHLVQHKKHYCQVYGYILSLALERSAKPKEDLCLLDYGTGNGLLGLLAKYAGVGEVFLNDITNDFLFASKQLAEVLNIPIDGFIPGDIEDIKVHAPGIKPDIFAGSDVIEHIYDLEVFFKTIQEINPAAVTVFSTASNPCNLFKVQQLKKTQIKDELYGGSPDKDILFGEFPEPSYLSMRKKIIQTYAGDAIDKTVIDTLATLSRGLNQADIERAVDNYIKGKILPVPIRHPTNTCDPLTGSWAERLLSLDEYEDIFGKAGFSLKSYSGFYNQFESTFKSRILRVLNLLIPFTGHYIAPFIVLTGTASKK